MPLKLYRDRDPSFESELFQYLMKYFEVRKVRSTGYNPQGNGLTGQSMSFCKNYLNSFVYNKPQE